MTSKNRFLRFHPLLAIVLLVAATALVAHARTRTTPGPQHPPLPAPTQARIEVAFVLDTTGSMSGLIEGAKQKIWSVANQLAGAEQQTALRVALIGYRDRGDDYVTRRFDLTDDVDAIYGHLQAFAAAGGGDGPESVNQALHEAVTRLDWSPGDDVYRVVFLVGDAPPHLDYQDDVPYAETARLAARRDIAINTIQCGSMASTTPIWKEIARLGHGQFASIAQDGAMVALESPFDGELAALNREVAETVLPWGSADERERLVHKVARSLKAKAPAAAARLSYLSKNGGGLATGRRDLVDAVKAGEVDVASLPPEALPEPMQAMDAPEREEFLQERARQRASAQARIAELSSERDAWIEEKTERRRAAGRAGFDEKVLETVREQAAAKGITY